MCTASLLLSIITIFLTRYCDWTNLNLSPLCNLGTKYLPYLWGEDVRSLYNTYDDNLDQPVVRRSGNRFRKCSSIRSATFP